MSNSGLRAYIGLAALASALSCSSSADIEGKVVEMHHLKENKRYIRNEQVRQHETAGRLSFDETRNANILYYNPDSYVLTLQLPVGRSGTQNSMVVYVSEKAYSRTEVGAYFRCRPLDNCQTKEQVLQREATPEEVQKMGLR